MSVGNIQCKEFDVDEQEEIEKLLQHFADDFHLREIPTKRANEFYYDSFDWRLFANNLYLKRIGKYFYLCSTNGEVLFKDSGRKRKQFFSADIQEGSLQKKVTSAVGIRALAEVLFLKKSSTQVNLLNKDKKTVARLFHEQAQVGADEEKVVPAVLRVVQVRGYEKAYAKAVKIAEQAGLKKMVDGKDFFQRGLAAIEREPGDYSSRFEIVLGKEVTIEEALNRICLTLVDTIDKNYSGVLHDIDSEFLHDFRVAIRRTRSFLSQFKKSFPSEKITFFKHEFKWLGTITGPVRDLDVYLLMKDKFTSMLPDDLHEGLEQFFVDLKKNRVERFEEMKKGLCSDRYSTLISEWKAFLELNGVIAKQKDDVHLCRPIALKKILKCFNKILKDGGKLDTNSPDEELHRLRIQGKKLRYLIEFFRSFFDPEEIEFFRKQLKKLQDMLGDFNDISVQLKMLSLSKGELTGRSKRSIAIAAAIGGLVTHLSAEQKELKEKFTSVFAEFSSDKNIDRFYAALV